MENATVYTLEEIFKRYLPATYWEALTKKYADNKKALALVKQCNSSGVAAMTALQINDHLKILHQFSQSLLEQFAEEKKEETVKKIAIVRSKQEQCLMDMLGERMCDNINKYIEMQSQPDFPDKLPKITSADADNLLKRHKVALFYFSATWCAPCKRLSPVISELAKSYKDQAMIGKVDIDEQSDFAAQHGIKSVPTMIFFKEGIEQKRVLGFQEAKTISDILDTLLK